MDFSVNYDENEFQIKDGELVVYKGQGGVVEIPKGVTVIGCEAFRSCTELTEVIIPEGVEEIRGLWYCGSRGYESFGAFQGCSFLKRISFPKSLRVIGKYAFENCTSLREVLLPEGLTEIDRDAFCGCTGLEKIYFPDSLKSIMLRAFANCIRLREISFPKNLTYIGVGAFGGCTGLIDFVVPESVKTVDQEAFHDCTSLQSAVISAQVKELKGTFHGCTALTEVMLPRGFEKLSSAGGLWDKYGVFENCSSLEQIELPAGISWIDRNTFRGCKKLEKVTIPAGVRMIRAKAFSGCSKLRQVILQEGLSEIERGAFEDCVDLTEILIPNSVKTIESGAFRGCTHLAAVEIPGHTVVAEGAFSDTAFVNDRQNWKDGILCLGSRVLEANPERVVGEVMLSSNITEICDGAFRDCTGMTAVTLPPGIQKIGSEVFRGCSSLQSIAIPGTVRKIGEKAFENCRALQSVVFSEGLEEICFYAFHNCTGIEQIKLPDSLKKLNDWSFSGCTGIKKVEISDYHLVKGIFPVHTYRHLIPNGFMKPVISYDGEVSYPEGFEELLEGHPVSEQLSLFRVDADSTGGWQKRCAKNNTIAKELEVDRYVEAILVKDGKVAGVMMCGKVCLPEHSVVTGYTESENNGAGYKGGEDSYSSLNCVPVDFEERSTE